ncbi:hypothetical protein FK531_11130 [Rhodococcus spelaei]|uniref:Secreted protein n=1 Tax=Rhodococcus spelaei TaxID=2546320 RepID=A0A541BAC3_9NOCA|nr:hypothetical protein [Rhodococcus spelaei]TQF69284.1 hypothetical protein FK531_11130 [Rhodococcus spelaei]
MNIRSFAVRAISAGAVTVAAFAGLTGTAAAAPAPAPILHLTLNGPVMPTLGQNAFCNGLIDTAVETDPARPGLATVSLTSRGMHGVGPEWTVNPVCRVKVSISWGGGAFTGQLREFDLNLGEQPGQTVRTEINPGSGAPMIAIGASYVGPQGDFRPQYSYPVTAVVIVP